MFHVHFEPAAVDVDAPSGMLIQEAAQAAGVELNIPCGGQGRCGRCSVLVEAGRVRRRSTLRLSADDVKAGYALACQSVIESDVTVVVPPQEKIQRLLTSDKTALALTPPPAYLPEQDQRLCSVSVVLDPPSMNDQTDDWSRLQRALRTQHGIEPLVAELGLLRRLGGILRNASWEVSAILEDEGDAQPAWRLIDLVPGRETPTLIGAAVDIGTTSNVVSLVDLVQGKVLAQAADYNGQISRGEDVISRIIYAGRNNGLAELQSLVLETLNGLFERAAARAHVSTDQIVKVTVAGNSTMMHLFLGLPPESIRLMPFITTVNHLPPITAGELRLRVHPRARVDCLPGIASYVGADITAGVLSSGLADADRLTLFLDIGTNGETVLGMSDWLITCACSAGPAFEGAGVDHGMRATTGAIEEVWINSGTLEPTYRVIGNVAPRGICGSGLISLLAELFITGIADKAGNLREDLQTPRLRQGRHGAEYVVAWAAETAHGRDIVLTRVDMENLLRTKAAIYAGYAVLCESVGVDLADVEEVLIGGAFGQYINVEKAIQIGLLPDMPWERFRFLGNTSLRGAYLALLSRQLRRQVDDVAAKMTYLELSADNRFYDKFTSALFMPHTEINRFPSVRTLLENGGKLGAEEMTGEPAT